MRFFTIDFGSIVEHSVMFQRTVDMGGTPTPLIGNFGGVDFFCFFQLVTMSIQNGRSLLDLHHSLGITRAGMGQLRKAEKALSARRKTVPVLGLDTLRIDRTKIYDCSLSVNLADKLNLDVEATVIYKFDGVNTYVREYWGPGTLEMAWTENTSTYPYNSDVAIAGIPRQISKTTVLKDAHVRATFVLDPNGQVVTAFVGNVRDRSGQLLYNENRDISGIEMVLDGRMEQPFPGAEPYVWGEGRFNGTPLIANQGDPRNASARFTPLDDLRLHGRTDSATFGP